MLAGLIFATEDADDVPGRLAATLPFGGSTLIEYQARLLIAAGASQLLVAVRRVTPELLGAANRIGKQISIDVVRSAAEAAAKVHPSAQVVVIADALVTTDASLSLLGSGTGDALLVTGESDVAAFERLDADACWAGLARIAAARLVETAALPNDYDFQSSLLRTAVQAGAAQVRLPAGSARAAHGPERNGAALLARSNQVFAALAANRSAWVERRVIAPLARFALPLLVRRAVPDLTVLGAGAIVAAAGCAALLRGMAGLGLLLIFTSIAALSVGAMLSWLRGEERFGRLQQQAGSGFATIGVLLAARAETIARDGAGTALVLALTLVTLGALVERAATEELRRGWWGSPPAYILVVLPFALGGHTIVGMAVAATYAGATLSSLIEQLRPKA